MTPDRWMVCAITGDEEPIKPEPHGYFAIGPWEPVASFWGDDCPVVFWRRPLRKVNTTMDSPDILR